MIDFDQLDKTIHEKSRLSIMTLLASRGEWAFQEMKSELGMSDGNLITHLRTLGTAGYVREQRDESGTRPRTTYHLTSEGRVAFKRYVDVLEAIVKTINPS
ncbi:Winged helix DNA-binding domain-containing protein [Prosthecobacter debontii]|uniref:Winged helix DNA-binding domain-containing protein n=1 Tax=Prosthecobacter debontii TaxID=48467 RepID=A0A1T4XKQ9_9BACT|nr:transcriptional regulator [Prosthecobacter debontii]SKA90076.1 Winged helix DNA-binding domain-containing protein [Prosthecobacter debontii]